MLWQPLVLEKLTAELRTSLEVRSAKNEAHDPFAPYGLSKLAELSIPLSFLLWLSNLPALPSLLFHCLLAALLLGGCSPERGAHPSGEILYHRYCASCHGVAGKGDGPVAVSLRKPPTDLTTLARRAGGHFDEASVMAVIDGKRLVAEHGPREMPVWGMIFDEELKDQPYTGYTVLLRSRVLADYLRSIQQE